jgi:hypothetical protein
MFFGGLIMNKFLITLATLVAFSLSGLAYAQEDTKVKVGGLMQRIAGMGDNVDGGLTEVFTRFVIGTSTTVDNGWTVGGSMSIQTAAATGGAAAPSTNSMYIQTDMMTVNIGNTVGALTSLIPAASAVVPGGGVDAGYQFNYDNGNQATQGVTLREAYYAMSNAKIDIDLPAVNGFTVGLTYTPSQEFAGTANARAQAETTAAHGETIEAAFQYSGELEGLSYVVGLGIITGNSQTINAGSANLTVNNDLNAVSGGLKVTMGNLLLAVGGFDNGDSYGASTDAIQSAHSGYSLNAVWNMGNISAGIGFHHQEFTRGTAGQAAATTLTGADAGNVHEDNFTTVGIGYDMGGGVSTYIQLSTNEHSDGDLATTEVNPQVLFAGISLGF